MAASIPVQPSQLPNALRAPSTVGRQDDSVIVTSVRAPSSIGSNSNVVVVVPDGSVASWPSQRMTIRFGGSASTTLTRNAPGKSWKSQVATAPDSSLPLAPPVVKYFESCAGSATASYTSAHGRLTRPETVKVSSVSSSLSDMLYIYNMFERQRKREPADEPDDGDDLVFKALASATRRRMLDRLRASSCTTGELCAAVAPLDRTTVLQHLRVLEAA